MADFSKCIGLAIIGIGAAGSGFKDIDSYGFRIYHGNGSSKEAQPYQWNDSDLQSLVKDTILHTGMDFGKIVILATDPLLGESIIKSGISSEVRNIPGREDGISHAFLTASELLENSDVNGVLLLQEHPIDHSLAGALVCQAAFAAKEKKQIWAILAGAANNESTDNTVAGLIQPALDSAELQPAAIGLFLTTDMLQSTPEMNSPQELTTVFVSVPESSCALSGGEGGLLSIIKTVWCLHKRVIPGTKSWTAPADLETWQNSAFYIPTESRTWFNSSAQPTRCALTAFTEKDKGVSVLAFCEGPVRDTVVVPAAKLENSFMFPVSGASRQELLNNLAQLEHELNASTDLTNSFCQSLDNFQASSHTDEYIACILGQTKESLSREIEFAIKGIPSVIDKKTDWRTPLGSYFSGQPLGNTGKISFVYPGAFNSYPGIGRDLFYLFPGLYERLSDISADPGALLNERMLYPRGISALSAADLDEAEKNLAADPLAMLISGTSLAVLFTFLLREKFDLNPASAFGYSLGEISMMFASGTWSKADETSTALRASPLFRTRLAGPQNAIRENWGLPTVARAEDGANIWENYVLMAAPDDVATAIRKEPHVYLTHINTPRQVVIAGDPLACRRVIEVLKCNSLQAPFNYALHCEAMRSEFNALQDLLSWPVSSQPNMKLFSAATYQTVPIEQITIAQQIATGLCHMLDFPRLVNQAFDDGSRIFIELGAGSNCSRWVDETLKDQPHAAFSINRKGLDDDAAVLQLLAKLICHQVPVNLSVLIV